MKQNIKSHMWSLGKISESKEKQAKLFLKSLLGLAFLILVVSVVTGAISWDAFMSLNATGTITATVIIGFGNIDGNPENVYKAGKQVKYRLWFVEAAQVDVDNFPSTSGRELSTIPLLAGQYWHYIDVVLDSPVPKSDGTMGDIAATIKNELTFVVAGMDEDILDLIEKGIGRGFYVVWMICATSDKYITGNSCKPATMTQFAWISDKDKTAATITFTTECGKTWMKYTGTTPTQAPATIAADATTIGLTTNPEYQLTNGTSAPAAITAFTGMTDADIGRVVTVHGSGGSHPSTISNTATAFLLVGGTQWVSNSGSQITFKIFKDGVSSYKFVEQSRV